MRFATRGLGFYCSVLGTSARRPVTPELCSPPTKLVLWENGFHHVVAAIFI